MIICHCMQLSDRAIRGAIRAGACSREELARACGAGAGCGGCQRALDELLDEARPPSVARVRLPLLVSAERAA
ncbi:BFD-like [2Fe-2S] binding domain protein [compost metagenome]